MVSFFLLNLLHHPIMFQYNISRFSTVQYSINGRVLVQYSIVYTETIGFSTV